MTAPESNDLKSTGYEIFIGLLSILSIFNIVLMYGFLRDGALQEILWAMNALLTAIFMGDFIYRFTTSSARAGYFFRRFGWADLLSSVPFGQFKIFRLFRLVHVYRLLRDRGPKNVLDSLVRDRAGSALLTLLLAGILVLEFGSLSILRIEEYAPGGNIKTASDALWYVIVTISTVGYGDFYPVTNHGRMVGALIIVVGVGIFGTFTGYLANIFLSPSKKKPAGAADADATATTAEVGLAKIADLKRLMAEQLAEIDELERALQEQRT